MIMIAFVVVINIAFFLSEDRRHSQPAYNYPLGYQRHNDSFLMSLP